MGWTKDLPHAKVVPLDHDGSIVFGMWLCEFMMIYYICLRICFHIIEQYGQVKKFTICIYTLTTPPPHTQHTHTHTHAHRHRETYNIVWICKCYGRLKLIKLGLFLSSLVFWVLRNLFLFLISYNLLAFLIDIFLIVSSTMCSSSWARRTFFLLIGNRYFH